MQCCRRWSILARGRYSLCAGDSYHCNDAHCSNSWNSTLPSTALAASWHDNMISRASGEWGSCWCGRTDLQDLDRQAVCSPDGRASNDRLPRLWLSSLGLHDPVLWFRGLITAYFVLETASIDSTGTNKHEKLTETRPFVGAYFVRYSWDNHNLPCLNTDSDISRNLIIWNRFQVDTQSC